MAIDQKDKKFIQYWENIMQLGRLPYSLIYGFIAGFFMFVLTNLVIIGIVLLILIMILNIINGFLYTNN